MHIPVVGLGAGGHAKVLLEIIQAAGIYKPIALLERTQELKGIRVLGVPVRGDDSELASLHNEGIRHFFVGAGSVADPSLRRSLYVLGLAHGMEPVTIIHPSSIVSPSAVIGRGAMILAAAVVGTSATLGENVIVNTTAVVEHDCTLGDHVHVATGAKLAGTVKVGNGAHIGAGAVVRECLTVGESAIVGAGAVVVSNVEPLTTVVGVPARLIRR